jgi:Uma2 family endonuclease
MENEVKEPAPKYNFISPGEYLEMERASEEKHEYYDGYVEATHPASISHNRVSANLYVNIGNFLKDKKCEIFPSQLKVCTPSRDTYIYPDATIVCEEPESQDDKRDVLLNPSVVFEVTSKSTEKNDYSYKFLYYQNIPSLKEYIMIDSRKRYAKVARNQGNNTWMFEDLTQPASQLYIRTIDFSISFDDIYRNTGL